MTDYIRQHQSPRHRFEQEEVERLERKFTTDTTVTDGVVRWNTNKQVPPTDILDYWRWLGKPFDHAKSVAAREADLDAFFAEYRRNQQGPSDEERAEARAAHGPGVELVNVITGHTWRT